MTKRGRLRRSLALALTAAALAALTGARDAQAQARPAGSESTTVNSAIRSHQWVTTNASNNWAT
ncbi:hypothetical protein [Streptomyces sp. NPDC059943]|uniref:hypothetical protein n=1 Tax=Streptomyces sp. NPDC059943 TaxID=3347010 RepID=UPI00364E19B4